MSKQGKGLNMANPENYNNIVLLKNFLWSILTLNNLRRHIETATVKKLFLLLRKSNSAHVNSFL
jgi:hypothetical protein